MNIVIITQLYPEPDDIGDNKPTHTVEYFAKEWVAMGHRVVLFHCPSKFPYVYYLIPPFIKNYLAGKTSNIFPSLKSRKELLREEFGISVIRYPMLKMLPGKEYSKGQMQRCGKKIINQLEMMNFQPDLIVGHFANPSTELTSILAKKYNAMSSIVFHNDCNENNYYKYRLNENLNNIHAIGARSIIESKSIRKLAGLQELPFVCYSGVPNEAIESSSIICDKHNKRDGINYLYVGSLIERKHVDIVIKAFLNIADDNDKLIIVGGGPQEKMLKGIVKQLNAEGRIMFTGRLSRDEVLNQMKEAHVFTLISSWETYGMVYIESMLQGCITIASKGGGFDGIIKDGFNGFLCEAGNQGELERIYKHIKEMNSSDRNRIGQNAIDLALHFSEREVAERYLNEIIRRQV